MKEFTDFYTAWEFIRNHKISRFQEELWSNFPNCLEIEVVKVNPKTKEIDDDESLNTETNVWLEFCNDIREPKSFVSCHWTELDCGAETFEKAIIKMANLVYTNYGGGK
jgi:hypothetical protein